jgi:hypothetical protein
MQLCLQCSSGRELHRSSGLQKAQAIRMTKRWITSNSLFDSAQRLLFAKRASAKSDQEDCALAARVR